MENYNNIEKGNINTLDTWPIDVVLSSTPTVSEGGTVTAYWDYVYRITSIDAGARTALVTLLHEGVEVDIKEMSIGDLFEVSNPDDNTQYQGIVLDNIFTGREVNAVFLSYYTWTLQDAILTEIDFPTELYDGESYTFIGKLTKSISGNPIVNEKVYITENDIKIKEAITDEDGVFSLEFTYYNGFNYNILYPGTFHVNGIKRILTTYEVPEATNMIVYDYPTEIPSAIIRVFRAISPIDMISSVTNLISDRVVDTGWEILDIKMSSNQILVYLKTTESETASLSNSSINKLDIMDLVTYSLLLISIIAIAIALFSTKISGIVAGAAIGGIVFAFLLIGRIKIWDFLNEIWSDIFDNEPTNEGVNGDIGTFYDKKLKLCKDTFDASGKTSEDCKEYAECMRDTTFIIDYTQGYLFGKAVDELSKIGATARENINNKCIKIYDESAKDSAACEALIECVTEEVNVARNSSNNTVYTYYERTSTYTAPWEKEKPEKDELLKGIGNILMGVALIAGGVIVYKTIKEVKK